MGFGNKQDLRENFSISLYQILPPPLFLRVELETSKHQAQKSITSVLLSQWGLISLVILPRLALAAGHGVSRHWVELRDPSILDGQNYYEYLYITSKNKFE